MVSGKCQKYMNQYQERNYAPKSRKIEKNDLFQYSNGNPSWKTPKTVGCDCVQQSRKELEKTIELYGMAVLLKEEVVNTGDENGQSKVGIGKPVQSSGEGCSEVGGSKPSSRRSSSRNEKVRKRKDGKDGRSRKEEG